MNLYINRVLTSQATSTKAASTIAHHIPREIMDDNNNNIGASGAANHEEEGAMMNEQEQLLPIANVGRIMKQILPPNAKISKEAKETMQECASEFISFVTGEASEKCRKERRKTVNGNDVCWALGALGFDDYTGPLRRFLHRYREQEGERISSGNNNNENNQDKANNTEDQQQKDIAQPSSYTKT